MTDLAAPPAVVTSEAARRRSRRFTPEAQATAMLGLYETLAGAALPIPR